jgi:hypothetical protein
MEITKNNYAEKISELTVEKKVLFYELFAHNLTICSRSIGFDEEISDSEKVEAMKWINEILHRVVAKIRVERLQIYEWKESDIIAMIGHKVKQSPLLGGEVSWAISFSYKNL